MAVSPGPNISPRTIAEAEFPSAFRGYETEAVRAFLEDVAQSFEDLAQQKRGRSVDDGSAAQIRELRKENLRLRSKLKADSSPRPSSTATVDLSDDQVAAVLGKEATRILEAARAAASDIIDRANEDASDIREQAQAEGAAIVDNAGKIMEERRSEAELEAAKTFALANKQADQIRAAAKADYDAIRSEVSKAMSEAKRVLKAQELKSEQRADKVARDADTYRKSVITELLQQRQRGADELSALLETRDGLAENIARAQRQIDELAVDLEEINNRQRTSFNLTDFEEDLERTLEELDKTLPAQENGDTLDNVHTELDDLQMDELDLDALETEVTDADIAQAQTELEPEKSLEDFIDLTDSNDTAKVERTVAATAAASESSNYFESGDLWSLTPDELPTSEIKVTFSKEDPVGDPLVDEDVAEFTASPAGLENSDGPAIEFNYAESDWDEIFMTVSGRSYGTVVDETRGDLPSMEPVSDAVPAVFKDRDVALSRLGPDLRRKIKRALNDDQSEVLDQLRVGSGPVGADELPSAEDQVVHYFEPLRENLERVAQAGAALVDGDPDYSVIEQIALQLARHLVTSVRVPMIKWLEAHPEATRESVMDPIRVIYRDYRNNLLASLLEDALFEVFAIGLYMATDEGAPTAWLPDPRLEPDPLCEINARTTGLALGEIYPSGHSRPLSLPGCRCLLVPEL